MTHYPENEDEFENGTFEIKGVRGTFIKDRNDLTITIVDKPFFISWDYLENMFNKFIN